MATAADRAENAISFGPFKLIENERLLTKDGVVVELGSRAFDILVALISAPNEVVSSKQRFPSMDRRRSLAVYGSVPDRHETVSGGLLLFSGCRRGDVVHLGRQHIRSGKLAYVPAKTRYKRVTISEKPILPELAAAIKAGPCGDLTFIVTEWGKPF